MAPLGNALHLFNVHKKFEQDQFQGSDEDAARMHAVPDDLLWWSRTLREGKRRMPG